MEKEKIKLRSSHQLFSFSHCGPVTSTSGLQYTEVLNHSEKFVLTSVSAPWNLRSGALKDMDFDFALNQQRFFFGLLSH